MLCGQAIPITKAARGSDNQTVNPAPLTITANNKDVTYDAVMPALTWTGNFVNGDTAGSLSASPVCTSTANQDGSGRDTSPAGTFAINCAGAASSDYSITYKSGTLTVNLSPVVLTFTGPPTLTVGSGPIESLKLTSAAGAPISGRRVTITLGITPRTVQYCMATTNKEGVAKCNIGPAPRYQRYRYITMTFAGDPLGPRYDYAAGEAQVKVLMRR